MKRLMERIKRYLFIKNKKASVIFALLFFVPLFCIFPNGALLNDTRIESISYEMADVTKNNTVQGNYLSLLVESKDEKSNPLRVPYSEFYNLYGNFRESKITFAGTVNADKKSVVKMEGVETDNLSFLYSNVFSNKEYNGHFKHEYYPIELMFEGKHIQTEAYSFCYISQTQADKILISKNIPINQDSYSSLLSTIINLNIDGNLYPFVIEDIYYETNYYYEGLKEIMGEFIISYTKYPDNLRKQACYFMREYPFQNRYYMNRINSLYNIDAYDVKIGNYNIIKPVNEEYLTSFYYELPNQGLNAFSIVNYVLLSIAFLCSLYILVFFKLIDNWFKGLVLVVLAFFPYIFFRLGYLISHSVSFFSSTSAIINFVFILLLLLVLIFVFLKSLFAKGFVKDVGNN